MSNPIQLYSIGYLDTLQLDTQSANKLVYPTLILRVDWILIFMILQTSYSNAKHFYPTTKISHVNTMSFSSILIIKP